MSMILSDSRRAALAASIRMSISSASVILGESMNVIMTSGVDFFGKEDNEWWIDIAPTEHFDFTRYILESDEWIRTRFTRDYER